MVENQTRKSRRDVRHRWRGGDTTAHQRQSRYTAIRLLPLGGVLYIDRHGCNRSNARACNLQHAIGQRTDLHVNTTHVTGPGGEELWVTQLQRKEA